MKLHSLHYMKFLVACHWPLILTPTHGLRTTDTQRLNLKFFAAQIQIPLPNVWTFGWPFISELEHCVLLCYCYVPQQQRSSSPIFDIPFACSLVVGSCLRCASLCASTDAPALATAAPALAAAAASFAATSIFNAHKDYRSLVVPL